MPSTPEPHDSAAELAFVRAVLAGSEPALVRFNEYLACLPRMLARVNSRLARPLGPDDLLDVQQDVYVILWRKLPGFTGNVPLGGWLYRTCKHELHNAMRRRLRHLRMFTDTPELAEPVTTGEHSDARARISSDQLLAALERLGGIETEIIQLKHFERMTFDEIGSRLDISPNTVKTRYYRGAKHLRRILDTSAGEEP